MGVENATGCLEIARRWCFLHQKCYGWGILGIGRSKKSPAWRRFAFIRHPSPFAAENTDDTRRRESSSLEACEVPQRLYFFLYPYYFFVDCFCLCLTSLTRCANPRDSSKFEMISSTIRILSTFIRVIASFRTSSVVFSISSMAELMFLTDMVGQESTTILYSVYASLLMVLINARVCFSGHIGSIVHECCRTELVSSNRVSKKY